MKVTEEIIETKFGQTSEEFQKSESVQYTDIEKIAKNRAKQISERYKESVEGYIDPGEIKSDIGKILNYDIEESNHEKSADMLKYYQENLLENLPENLLNDSEKYKETKKLIHHFVAEYAPFPVNRILDECELDRIQPQIVEYV